MSDQWARACFVRQACGSESPSRRARLARVFHVEQRRQTVPQCTGHGPTSLGETHCAQTHVERPMSSAGTVMHVDELLSGAGSRQCTPVPRSAP